MTLQKAILAGAFALAAGMMAMAAPAVATPVTGDVTNGVYFGSGNANGQWTIETSGVYEIALRAKVFGGSPIAPSPTGVYEVSTGLSPLNSNRAAWNWEFSIDNLDSTGLAGMTAMLTISSAGMATTSSPIDLLAIPDNAIRPPSNSGEQNSENMVFGFLPGYSVWAGDTYTFTVTLADSTSQIIATNTMVVNAVPEPATITLTVLGLAGLAAARRRRR